MTRITSSKWKYTLLSALLGISLATVQTNAWAAPKTHKTSTHKKSSTKKTSKKKKKRTPRRIIKHKTSVPSLLSSYSSHVATPTLRLDEQVKPSSFESSQEISEEQVTPVKDYSNDITIKGKTIKNILAKEALSFLGVPYKYGGTSPKGFDCSGIIYYIAKNHNISTPRTAYGLAHYGTQVDRSQLKVGDLVFFSTRARRRYSHVGIYIGNDRFVHAPRTGYDVMVSSLKKPYYDKHFSGARRLQGFE